jgi:hypothetical protein
MDKNKFDPKEPVQFRQAPEQVRIIATDLKDDRAIVIAIIGPSGRENVAFRHIDGRVYPGVNNPYDLVNVPKKHEVWINLYHTEDVFFGCAYPTREQANAKANIDRTACVRVEFTEGEGL